MDICNSRTYNHHMCSTRILYIHCSLLVSYLKTIVLQLRITMGVNYLQTSKISPDCSPYRYSRRKCSVSLMVGRVFLFGLRFVSSTVHLFVIVGEERIFGGFISSTRRNLFLVFSLFYPVSIRGN